jgi:hypothetical protein
MAETLLSPGVLARENDLTVTAQTPAPIGAAIVGPTVKGIPYVPKLITSFTQYLTYFGGTFLSGSTQYTYFTSTAAYNYFQNGGTSLWVTRVASGSFTSASAYTITGSSINPNIEGAVAYLNASSASFQLATISYGANQNSSGSVDASGSLANGTPDNIRWEITAPNTSSGTFTLLVRRGDDNNNNKVVLETWTNLSLDPTAPNYIEKIIGNQYFAPTTGSSGTYEYVNTTGNYPNRSNYVTITNVLLKTPYYFDNNGNAKAQYTASIPRAQQGFFGNAVGNLVSSGGADKYYNNITDTNIQGLIVANYTGGIEIMSNQDEYAYNVIAVPGLTYGSSNGQAALKTLINNTTNRGDAIAVVDMALYGSNVTAVTSTANTVDTSYAATYWPWIQTVDPLTSEFTWVPASTMIPAVYANNDTVAAPWFAPAGLNRGGIINAIRAEKKLTNGDRNTLYQNKVNPIATFPGQGVVVYGQKTLQTKSSALDRVNVRRLLIALKARISEIANNLVFEQNTIATRQSFLNQVNPYLESVQQQQGLYAYKVIMDDSNNTADVIDRNELIGQIYLQPTKTAEFIYLDFNILPTGATFPG